MRDVEPSLMVKKDGMILEGNYLNIFSPPSSSIQKDFQSPSEPHVSYPSQKD